MEKIVQVELTPREAVAVAHTVTTFLNFMEANRIHFPRMDLEGVVSCLKKIREKLNEQQKIIVVR